MTEAIGDVVLPESTASWAWEASCLCAQIGKHVTRADALQAHGQGLRTRREACAGVLAARVASRLRYSTTEGGAPLKGEEKANGKGSFRSAEQPSKHTHIAPAMP